MLYKLGGITEFMKFYHKFDTGILLLCNESKLSYGFIFKGNLMLCNA